MKRVLLACCITLAAFNANAQSKGKKPVAKKTITKAAPIAVALKNSLDSASYSFGMAMGSGLKGNGLTTLNYELLVRGLKDAFGTEKFLISKEDSQQAINNLMVEKSKAKFAVNRTEGEKFLLNNKKINGVKTTASGLQYMVMKQGNGRKPAITDTVSVNYKGSLLSGKQFDSNEGKEPISLPLNHVIAGWTEGLQLMSEGAKYRFFIPYTLAYGEQGAGQDIPPYSTLIFEVELVKIK
ncbi:MAG: peptidylprolyl isomerase [Pedobacter sp.]|jgi:FKBP-type peptidyl-prolyl cis-trans isomerase|nr:peptidylprolyl isomerase [Pedobacter sp.]